MLRFQKIIYEKKKEIVGSRKGARKEKEKKGPKWPGGRGEANPGHRGRNLNETTANKAVVSFKSRALDRSTT